MNKTLASAQDAGGPAGGRAGSVGFFAPSGFLPDPLVMDRAAEFFTARGWRVSAGESVFARELRFAGPDELRAGELQRFATDRSLDVAIAARGGYGLTRLLGELDYEAIAAARVPLVGYSDFTAFSLALLAKAGASASRAQRLRTSSSTPPLEARIRPARGSTRRIFLRPSPAPNIRRFLRPMREQRAGTGWICAGACGGGT